jgi:hypothetical protein
MDGGGFIRELCVALEHRWKPEELFLLYTAYFDESDTHGRQPNMIMAAFLGHATRVGTILPEAENNSNARAVYHLPCKRDAIGRRRI